MGDFGSQLLQDVIKGSATLIAALVLIWLVARV